MASGSGLGVDIISDSSISSSETDSDSDGNVRFSEFDSDSRSRRRCVPAILTWGSVNRVTHLCLPGINRTDHGRTQSLISTIPIPDQPTVSLNAEATTLDFFSLFIDDVMLLRWCDFTETNTTYLLT